MESGIYQILNSVTGTRYIGQAANIEKRKQQHFAALASGKHHCKYMQRAFDKYGIGSFDHSVVELCNSDQITAREQHWMDVFRTSDGIYNSAPAAGSPLGIKRSDETREKLRAAKAGCKHSDETKHRMSDAHTKLKEKHSALLKAQWADPTTRAALVKNMKGRLVSDTTKEKLCAGLRARWGNAEYRSRVSANQKIAQAKTAGQASERMVKKWADPEFKRTMMLARKAAKEKIVEFQI